MATHQYAIHPRDAMVLSLDSSFYSQEPFQHHQQQQHHNYYSGYGIYQTTNEQQQQQQDDKHLQLLETSTHQLSHMSEHEIPCFKTWMDHHHALEQQVNNTSMVESLSLSMSPGSQSSCITASRQISPTETTECVAMETKKRGAEKLGQKQTVHRKSIDTFGQRTSQYRGVTRSVLVFIFFFKHYRIIIIIITVVDFR